MGTISGRPAILPRIVARRTIGRQHGHGPSSPRPRWSRRQLRLARLRCPAIERRQACSVHTNERLHASVRDTGYPRDQAGVERFRVTDGSSSPTRLPPADAGHLRRHPARPSVGQRRPIRCRSTASPDPMARAAPPESGARRRPYIRDRTDATWEFAATYAYRGGRMMRRMTASDASRRAARRVHGSAGRAGQAGPRIRPILGPNLKGRRGPVPKTGRPGTWGRIPARSVQAHRPDGR